jgi:hypothetical protein
MEWAWAATGVDHQPQHDHNRWWGTYFYLFIFIGNVCMLNMFISLVVHTYQESKEEAQNLHLLNEHQREWFKIKLAIYQMQPLREYVPPPRRIQQLAFKLTNQKYLRALWLTCIGLSVLITSLHFARESRTQESTQSTMKAVLVSI